MVFEDGNYGFWTFNLLGLAILKKLSRDPDNRGKIGNTRGLLPKIIDSTHTGERLLRADGTTSTQILTVKRSLQLVKILASTTGATGKQLRKEISEIVFTISNIRDILRFGEKYLMLQKLGIEILSNLALEEDATERIGCTGGIFKELFNIFFMQTVPQSQNHVRISAGEAISMLALESKNSCRSILRLNVSDKLVTALEDTVLQVNAARILWNLCVYSGTECFQQLRSITAAGPTVLKAIMKEENKLQEVMIGLAAHVFKFMSSQESRTTFENAGIEEADLANKLIQILNKHQSPSIKVPRIRRNIQIFRNLGMEKELEWITKTISDVESFNIFSGTVGMSRRSTTMHSLVETARELLLDDQNL
ncbi:hypothetical protein LIER_07810 [Lithospermum erythrorhizon]|uniref:Uncharacterized protein n=1 Tax=Lithospermum erythrorhizon TaxID=34254 RepID=A0AAV3PDV2_LITER